MQAFALGRTAPLCVTYAVLLLDFLPVAGVALIDTAKLKITFGIDIDLPNLDKLGRPRREAPEPRISRGFFRLNKSSR